GVPARPSAAPSIIAFFACPGRSRVISFSIQPGPTALTQMLRLPISRASAPVSPMSPALATAYAVCPTLLCSPTTLIMFTMLPPPRFSPRPNATAQPPSASRSATDRPIPRELPVTNATFPSNSRAMSHLRQALYVQDDGAAKIAIRTRCFVLRCEHELRHYVPD